MDDRERKLINILRFIFIKIPMVLWIIAIIALIFLDPVRGIILGVASSVIMVPWLCFFNWII